MDAGDKLKAVQKRRQEILDRLENCRREMARCHEDLRRLHEEEDAILLNEAETDALASASRLSKSAFDASDRSDPNRMARSLDPDSVSINQKEPNRGKGTRHPKGAPSIVEMVQQILWEARTTEPDGLTGREIVKRINDKWWPGVSQNSILPKLYKCEPYRFFRKYDRWTLPQELGHERDSDS